MMKTHCYSLFYSYDQFVLSRNTYRSRKLPVKITNTTGIWYEKAFLSLMKS
jgi:hypothetical protein